jgi:hypothetical protein
LIEFADHRTGHPSPSFCFPSRYVRLSKAAHTTLAIAKIFSSSNFLATICTPTGPP